MELRYNITQVKPEDMQRLEELVKTFPLCLLEWSIEKREEGVFLIAQTLEGGA